MSGRIRVTYILDSDAEVTGYPKSLPSDGDIARYYDGDTQVNMTVSSRTVEPAIEKTCGGVAKHGNLSMEC